MNIELQIKTFTKLFLSLIFVSTITLTEIIPNNCALVDNGICKQCLTGYRLTNNQCIIESGGRVSIAAVVTVPAPVNLRPQIIIEDWNCKTRLSGSCQECYPSFYYNINSRLCTPVNPLCKTFNNNGACLSCYEGYYLSEDSCRLGTEEFQQTKENEESERDMNCFKFEANKCIECSYKYFFGKSGKCEIVEPNCRTWNNVTGDCSSCFEGFWVVNGDCLVLNTEEENHQRAQSVENENFKNEVQNCNEYDSLHRCIRCAYRFYYANNTCNPVDNLCKEWSEETGICNKCYDGYSLEQNKCTIRDPFCTIKSVQGCVQCASRYFLNDESVCQLVNPICKEYDHLFGFCTSCYQGYTLVGNNCTVLYL